MKQHGLRAVSRSARTILEQLVAGPDERGAHKKIDKTGGAFMPVCVERVEETQHGPVFSVAHYYEQAGDLVPDPDVTLLRAADGEFYPLSYQSALAYRRSVELGADGGVRVNRAQQIDLAHFVGGWLRNIKSQQGLWTSVTMPEHAPGPADTTPFAGGSRVPKIICCSVRAARGAHRRTKASREGITGSSSIPTRTMVSLWPSPGSSTNCAGLPTSVMRAFIS